MMNTLPYSNEELEILEAMENKTLKSVPHLEVEIEQVMLSVKNKLKKRKSVNLRQIKNG